MTTMVQRIDAVWDTYPEQSLKSQTQQRRGSGARTRLEPDGEGSTPIPKRNWQSYLKIVENKKELFFFVSKQLAKTDMDGIFLIRTESAKVLSNKPFDVSPLQPCNDAEADTRIILHLAHASSQGHDNAFVRTVDIEIVVLAIAFYEQLGLSELWIGFGSGKSYRDIPVHSIHAQFGDNDKHIKQWLPFWTTLDDASKACSLLVHCRCTKQCRWNCKCSRAGLHCTTLCKSEGG